jgi:hypothetical protein
LVSLFLCLSESFLHLVLLCPFFSPPCFLYSPSSPHTNHPFTTPFSPSSFIPLFFFPLSSSLPISPPFLSPFSLPSFYSPLSVLSAYSILNPYPFLLFSAIMF